MNKRWVFFSGLFVLGIVVGIVIMTISDNVKHGQWPADVTDTGDSLGDLSGVGAGISQQPVAAFSPGVENDVVPVQSLEDKVARLEARVLELEQKLDSRPEDSAKNQVDTQAVTLANTEASAANFRSNQLNRMLTTQSLVKAGISEEIAADIVRRRNEIELGKLELVDRASREGYAGTPRYARELSALMAEKISLREELGDASYDRYLYVNRQPNRVKATSVMLGSAAELAGMKGGDIILTYGDLRVFEWGELKQATSEGELGEYVSVDILRNGQLMSLWVPRGPLGVRLGSARVEP
jgi:hypothetical protein